MSSPSSKGGLEISFSACHMSLQPQQGNQGSDRKEKRGGRGTGLVTSSLNTQIAENNSTPEAFLCPQGTLLTSYNILSIAFPPASCKWNPTECVLLCLASFMCGMNIQEKETVLEQLK